MGADRKATIEIVADLDKAIKSFQKLGADFQAVTKRMDRALDAVDGDQLSAELKEAQREAQRLGTELVATGRKVGAAFDGAEDDIKAAARATDRFEQELKQAAAAAKKTKNSVSGLRSAVGLLLGAFAGLSLKRFAEDAGRLAIKFDSLDKAALAVFETNTKAAEALKFIGEEADRLGQDVFNLTDRYIKFSAATKGTILEGEKSAKIFISVTEALTALGVSQDGANGALLAFQQIVSKGKISAEELRQQLAERIPGAVNIFADAIGVSSQKLDELLASGKLGIETLVPFADELANRFGKRLPDALESSRAKMTRLSNSFTRFKVEFGKAFLDDLIAGLQDVEKSLGSSAESATILGNALGFVLRAGIGLAQFSAGAFGTVLGVLTDKFLLLEEVIVEVARGINALTFRSKDAEKDFNALTARIKELRDVATFFAENSADQMVVGLEGMSAAAAALEGNTAKAKKEIDALAEAEEKVSGAAFKAAAAEKDHAEAVKELTESVAGNREELDKQVAALLAVQEALIAQGAPLEALKNLGVEAQELVEIFEEFGIKVPEALKSVAAQAFITAKAMQDFGDDFEKVGDSVVKTAEKVEAALIKAFKVPQQKESKAFKDRQEEIASLEEEIEGINSQTIQSADDINRLEEATDQLRAAERKRVTQYDDVAEASVQSADAQRQALEGVNDLVKSSREELKDFSEEYPQLEEAALGPLESIIRTLELQNETLGASGADVELFSAQFELALDVVKRQAEESLGALRKGFKDSKEGSDDLGESLDDTKTELEKVAEAIETLKTVTKEGFVDGIKGAEEYRGKLEGIVVQLERIKECSEAIN